jgi:hypothetical protein
VAPLTPSAWRPTPRRVFESNGRPKDVGGKIFRYPGSHTVAASQSCNLLGPRHEDFPVHDLPGIFANPHLDNSHLAESHAPDKIAYAVIIAVKPQHALLLYRLADCSVGQKTYSVVIGVASMPHQPLS